MKKILVTGSNGLLGQKLTAHLLRTGGFELIATSRGPNRYPGKSGYDYLDLDITNTKAVNDAISQHKPDVVINTAAITMVDVCQANEEACYNLNVKAVSDLAQACERTGAHLIHLSTDFVFDGTSGPYREDDLPNPLSYYGKTKLLAEKSLAQSSCNWTIVRTVLVYGVTSDMSRSNIVLWAKSALEKGQPIRVVSDHWRTPTLVEDLAAGCLLAAEKGAQGVFHISGGEGMSILELVYKVADYWNLDRSLITPIHSSVLNEAPRPPVTGFVIDKARTELGYEPRTFEDGLRMVDMQLAQR